MNRLTKKLFYLDLNTKITEETLAKYYSTVAALYDECNYSEALKGFNRLIAYNGDFSFYLIPYIERCNFLLKTPIIEREVKNLSLLKKLGFVKENITKAFSNNFIRCKHCGQWTRSEFESRRWESCFHCSSKQPALSVYSDSWGGLALHGDSAKFLNQMMREHPVEYGEWIKLATQLQENRAIISSGPNDWIDYQVRVLKHIQSSSWYRRAINYREMEDFNNAILCLNKTLELDPSQPDIWEQLGMLYQSAGAKKESSEAYEKALKEWCRLSEFWCRFRFSKNSGEWLERGLKYLERAQKIDPNNLELWLKKADILEGLTRFTEALGIHNLVLNMRPADDDLLHRKARSLMGLGLFEQAIEVYDQAVNIKPDNEVLWFYRSEALIKLMKLDEALSGTDKCIELSSINNSPFGGIALYQRAQISALKGDKARTLADLAKAIALEDRMPVGAEEAKKDIAFKNLWDDPDFIKIMDLSGPKKSPPFPC